MVNSQKESDFPMVEQNNEIWTLFHDRMWVVEYNCTQSGGEIGDDPIILILSQRTAHANRVSELSCDDVMRCSHGGLD